MRSTGGLGDLWNLQEKKELLMPQNRMACNLALSSPGAAKNMDGFAHVPSRKAS